MTDQAHEGWRATALGSHFERIEHEAVAALCEAHREATSAQHSQGSTANDTYGHTLKVRQHEILNDRIRQVPGVVLRKPAGVQSRFDFPVVEVTNTVIVPLRFSTDVRVRHDMVHRIDLSELRRALLTGLAPPKEPDLFDAVSGDDYEARYREALHAHEQLETAGRTVVIGFGSTPEGIFEIGVGELIVDDAETGAVSWRRWHPLPVYADLDAMPTAPYLRAVVPATPSERFDTRDDTEGDDDLNLRLRPIVSDAPNAETREEGEARANTEDSSS